MFSKRYIHKSEQSCGWSCFYYLTLPPCPGFHDTRQNAELKEDNVELEETDGSILWENSGHAAIYYVGHDHEFRGYIAL
jgi:hypothetical protein